MAYKDRVESRELKQLRSVNCRMDLPDKDANYYTILEKGFEGELKSDLWLEGLSKDWLILNDLLLESNNSLFQIDTLLISQDTLYPLEIKNYEGDFFIDSEKWYTLAKKLIKNPLHQMDRSETLFRQLLQSLGYNLPIESYVIFINPEFHLYQAPHNPSIIFPAQLNRFLKKLNKKSVKLNGQHFKLADQLISRHIIDSPYTILPSYTYDQLKKGIMCPLCYSLFSSFNGVVLECGQCACKESAESAVLRSVAEFKGLFPNRKISTNAIHEWCEIISSKKTIRRILSKNFKLIRKGKASYYDYSQKNGY